MRGQARSVLILQHVPALRHDGRQGRPLLAVSKHNSVTMSPSSVVHVGGTRRCVLVHDRRWSDIGRWLILVSMSRGKLELEEARMQIRWLHQADIPIKGNQK